MKSSKEGRDTIDGEEIVRTLSEPGEGVVFANCYIATLILGAAPIVQAVRFENCTLDYVGAVYAKADAPIQFNDCHIGTIDGSGGNYKTEVQFLRSHVGRCVFNNAIIGRSFLARKTNIGTLELVASKIGVDLLLEGSVISEATISGIQIGQLADLTDSIIGTFDGIALSAQSVNFDRAFLSTVTLERAHLARGLAARGTVVEGSFDADLLEGAPAVVLGGLLVKGKLSFDHAHLGVISIERFSVGEFAIFNAQIRALAITLGRTSLVTLSDCAFAGGVQLNGVKCEHASIIRCRVEGPLSFDVMGASLPSFGELSVVGNVVAGQLTLTHVSCRGDIALSTNSALDLGFTDCRSEGSARISNSHIAQSFSMTDVTIRGSLRAQSISVGHGVQWKNVRVGDKVDLLGARISGLFTTIALRANQVSLVHARIEASLFLDDAIIRETLDLTRATIGELVLAQDLQERGGVFKYPATLEFRDCAYSGLRVAWRDLVEALERQGRYDAPSFERVETQLRAVGRSDWADEVYYRSRRRGSRERTKRSSIVAQRLLGVAAGYGAIPMRILASAGVMFLLLLLLVSSLLIILGDKGFTQSPLRGKVVESIVATLDLVIRGDGAGTLKSANGSAQSHLLRILLDLAFTLRFVFLAALGLWLAYVSGLVRYRGGSNQR